MTDTPNGMLFVASDIAPADEADFNAWYDHEHVEERARIAGFISGARYRSVAGGKRYLGLYRTRSLDVFTSSAYKVAFSKQTAWSVANLDRMLAPSRRVAEVLATTGQGSGAWLGVLTLDTQVAKEELHLQLAELGRKFSQTPGFIQTYLLYPDTPLSTPLPKELPEGRRLLPIFILEASSQEACESISQSIAASLATCLCETAIYALQWKLYASELS